MSTQRSIALSRRRFLELATGTAVTGVLAACTPKSSPGVPTSAPQPGGAATVAPAPQEGLKLSYWVFWTQYGDLVDQFRETEEFKAALGGNELDVQVGVKQEVFLTNIAAGTPPDIAGSGRYDEYMSKGVLKPIDDLVAQSSVIKKSDFYEPNWDMCFLQGVQYGVPANEGFVRRGLFYNEQLVADAGLDPEQPPETWEECFEWHKALTKFDDAGNVKQIGLDPFDAEGGTGPGNDGFFIADSFGFDWFNPETGEFNLDCPEMAEGLDTMAEFVKLIGADNMVALRGVEGQGTWGGAFNAGVQVMIIEGYWHCGETMHEKPEVAKLIRAFWPPVPERRRGTKFQTAGGHMVVFFKDAKYGAEAFPIAEFLQTKAACDIIFNTIGWLPAYTPYLDTVDPTVFPGLEFIFQSTKEATVWYGPSRCPINPFIATKYQEMREAVFRGNMTGAQAAAELQAAVEAEWRASGNA